MRYYPPAWILLCTWISLSTGCASLRLSHPLEGLERLFYRGEFARSLDRVRARTASSQRKDRLLYLMEAGTILHVMGEYRKSNIAFGEADALSTEIKKSISKEIAAFFLNDTSQNFRGESFERVLIKLYIAVNHLAIGEYTPALRMLRKLNYELKDIKYFEEAYRQNHAARYLSAIVAETLEEYNLARVQYNNMIQAPKAEIQDIARRELYALALKTEDEEDLEKYRVASNEVRFYDQTLTPCDYTQGLGSLVIIHEAGRAAVKRSRGKLGEDEVFREFLDISVVAALASQGAALSPAFVLGAIAKAQNPVPIYVPHVDKKISPLSRVILDERQSFLLPTLDHYSETALRNYNDRYKQIVSKNAASIATRAVSVIIASEVAAHAIGEAVNSSWSSLVRGLMSGFMGASLGGILSKTIRPDLRCWRLNFDYLQILRIHLAPGEYSLKLQTGLKIRTPIPERVKIFKEKSTFVIFRTF